jgi:hypothetical protein
MDRNHVFIAGVYLLLVFSIFALSSLPFVSAEIEINTYPAVRDFSILHGISIIDACSCAEKSDVFTVTNSGSFAAIFYVSYDTRISGARFSEESFPLSPGESRDIILYLAPECSSYKKDMIIIVRSNLDVSKSFTKTVERKKCQNIELWMSGPDKSSSCKTVNYLVFIRNIGPFAEQYVLSSNKQAMMSSDSFGLLPGQIAQINASISLDCSESGSRDIIFNVKSLKNGLEASVSKTLSIAADNNYEVLMDGFFNNTAQVCNRVWETSIPITIHNNGIDNEFTVEFKGLPEYIYANYPKTFFLERGASKTIYLIVNSQDFRSEHKKQNIDFSVRPKYGLPIDEHLSILLQPCYEHSIMIEKAQNSEDNPFMSCSGSDYSYDFLVSNNGLYTENILLSLEGNPSGFALSQGSVKLSPGEVRRLTLTFTGPESNYLYDVRINARLKNSIVAHDDLWVQAYDTNSCYAVSLKNKVYNINYDSDSIKLRLENNGLISAGGVYDLSIIGIKFAHFSDDIIILNSTYSNIALQLDTSNISEGTYNGKLMIEELYSGASYTQDISIRLKDKSFIRKTFEFFFYGTACRQGSFYEFVAIMLVCILIVIFMIIGPHYPYKFWNRVKSKIPIMIMLIIIFIVVAALSLFILGIPKTEIKYNLSNNLSGLEFDAVSGKEFKLYLAQFFKDPDNNTMQYVLSEINHVDVKIYGDTAIFVPDSDFIGLRQFIVTAYDSDNASVESPMMTLNVLPRKTFSPAELYNTYCMYINLVLFAVLLMLVFLAFIVKQKKRGRKNK